MFEVPELSWLAKDREAGGQWNSSGLLVALFSSVIGSSLLSESDATKWYRAVMLRVAQQRNGWGPPQQQVLEEGTRVLAQRRHAASWLFTSLKAGISGAAGPVKVSIAGLLQVCGESWFIVVRTLQQLLPMGLIVRLR